MFDTYLKQMLQYKNKASNATYIWKNLFETYF